MMRLITVITDDFDGDKRYACHSDVEDCKVMQVIGSVAKAFSNEPCTNLSSSSLYVCK